MIHHSDAPLLTKPEAYALNAAQGVAQLLDVLDERTPDEASPMLAWGAAETALRASLASYFAIACPDQPAEYYAAVADEVVAILQVEGREVGDAIESFFAFGFRRTVGLRPGHDPWVEPRRDGYAPGCICGWSGRSTRRKLTADEDAIGHASWPLIQRMPR